MIINGKSQLWAHWSALRDERDASVKGYSIGGKRSRYWLSPHIIQRDSKRWTQFRTSIFPELYTVCE